MKLFSMLVSILAVSSSAKDRIPIGNETKPWSPVATEDFVHVCSNIPEEYKTDCEDIVTFPFPPEVIREVLENLEPEEKSYWLTLIR